jgi:uncharacterized peroxidase-related enzyme
MDMRLAILDKGHGFGTKLLFTLIRVASRRPIPGPVKLISYRRDFFGAQLKKVTHEAMRGPSRWSVADRELMAAFVSKLNQCEYCIKAHAAVAAAAYRDETKVSEALAEFETAAIDEPLRATLRMLAKLSREQRVSADELRELLAIGVSREQAEDALAVAFAFNTMNRLADTFGFFVPDQAGFESGAKYLLARGYR